MDKVYDDDDYNDDGEDDKLIQRHSYTHGILILIDLRTRGTGDTCSPTFTNFFVKCPFSASIVVHFVYKGAPKYMCPPPFY